jgi:phospholipid/cholesterol/gamma-HCH transport system substrate-binding protein
MLRSPKFRYTNEAVGLFVLITILLFVAALLYSGQIRKWFDPGESLKVVMPEEGLFGLSEGSSVEILGTKAGQVRNIVIDPSEKMYAEVRIDSDMKAFVRRDSVATIRKTFGIAGDSYLEITRGSKEPLDWEYAVITAVSDRRTTETIGELIDQMREKVFPVIDDTQEAIRTFLEVARELQASGDQVKLMLGNVNAITGKISRGEGAIGRLLTEDKLAKELEDLIARLNREFEQIDPIFDDLKVTTRNVSEFSTNINAQSENLPEITRTLKEALAAVKAVMTDLSQTTPHLPQIAENVTEATDDVPVLVLQLQQAMIELELLLRQLQSHWLLGGSRSQSSTQSVRISPLEVSP